MIFEIWYKHIKAQQKNRSTVHSPWYIQTHAVCY